MGIQFNRIVRPDLTDIESRLLAEDFVRSKAASLKMVFMSHKIGDKSAEREASYIARTHRVRVYMTEWDERVEGDTNALPAYIMNAIHASNGFLVNVVEQIRASMWIGYEIGGAHALGKTRAKLMYHSVPHLPSVVDVLHRLEDRRDLDSWIVSNVL